MSHERPLRDVQSMNPSFNQTLVSKAIAPQVSCSSQDTWCYYWIVGRLKLRYCQSMSQALPPQSPCLFLSGFKETKCLPIYWRLVLFLIFERGCHTLIVAGGWTGSVVCFNVVAQTFANERWVRNAKDLAERAQQINQICRDVFWSHAERPNIPLTGKMSWIHLSIA